MFGSKKNSVKDIKKLPKNKFKAVLSYDYRLYLNTEP